MTISIPATGTVAQFASTDIDEIATWYADRRKVQVSVDAPPGAPSTASRLDSRQLGQVSVTRAHIPTTLTIATPRADVYTLMTIGTGAMHFDEGGTGWFADRGIARLNRPPQAPRLSRIAAGTDMMCLQFNRWHLERHLEKLIEDSVPGPINFDAALPTAPDPPWLRLFHLFGDVLKDPDSLVWHPMVTEPLTEAVMTALLYAADHPYREQLQRPAPPARPRRISVVIDMIHAHPEQAYTVSEFARLAGISVRSLQEGFRQHIGMSPTAYLRRVRLARVHEELRRGQAGTVTEAAHRWGFTHLGRFAAAYASVYGVAPSATLSAELRRA